jgi:proteasome lid subunit RPN8/RPN11
VRSELQAHALDEAPRECCGILLGVPGRILLTRRAMNLAEDPSRFLLDPHAHLAAVREARHSNLEVVGFYHSHPRSRAEPSPRDLEEAVYLECVHLIVGRQHPTRGPFEVRAFYLGREAWEEVALVNL